MLVRTTRLSSKGQLTLPIDMMRALGLKRGTELVVIQKGEGILLVPAERVAALVEDEVGSFGTLAEPAFADVWGNEIDEVWNDV